MIKLLEIVRKIVKPVTENRTKVYFQDIDNLYPNRVKGLIENSPTAFRSSRLMAKFIVGKGLKDLSQYNLIVDNALKLNVCSFSHVLAKSLANQNGFFVHISYKYNDGQIVPSYSRVLNFEDCRISRVDDNGYLGKLYVKEWDTSSLSNNKQELKEYYTFTKNQSELIEQIQHNWKSKKKDKEFNLIEAIKIFSGQYYYYNPNIGNIYPLSYIHAVINDCDTEYRIGNYTNGEFRKGMLGKVVVMTDGLSEEDQDDVDEVFRNFLGDENASDMVFFPVNLENGKSFDDSLKIVQLKPQYDEKFISETIPRLRKNIMSAFNNIPEPLVNASDGALFGTSSDTYSEMKKFYSEQNDEERESIYKFFKDVYDLDVEFETFGSELTLNTVEND